MAEIPEIQERQVARGVAAQRALRPDWREAAITGAVFGAGIGVLALLFPVLPLGPSEPQPAVTVAALVRALVLGALSGVVVFSVVAFVIRVARRAIAAARYGAPVA